MLERFLSQWVRWSNERPFLSTFILFGILAGLSYSIYKTSFSTQIETNLPTHSGDVLKRIDSSFQIREQTFLILKSERPSTEQEIATEELLNFATQLDTRLELQEEIHSVTYGYEDLKSKTFDALAPYAPRYASPEQAEEIENLFNPEKLKERLERQIARLSLPGLGDSEELFEKDPFDFAPYLVDRLQGFKGAFKFHPDSSYYLSEDQLALLVRIRGTLSVENSEGLLRTTQVIDEAIREAHKSIKHIEVYKGGGYYLGLESQNSIQRDLIIGLSTSMFFVLLLMAWVFRSGIFPLIVFPLLLFGLVWALGWVSVFTEEIVVLALGSTSIQIGLGVDFAVHYALAARARREGGLDPSTSLIEASRWVGPGLVIAASTTMGAFLAFLFSSFDFLKQMGQLTAIGLLGALIATLTLLPAWNKLWLKPAPIKTLGVGRVVDASLRIRTLIVGLTVLSVLTCVVYLAYSPPEFESNLRNLHSKDSRAIHAEQKVVELFGGTEEPLMVLFEGPDDLTLQNRLEQVDKKLESLSSDSIVLAHFSGTQLLPDPASEQQYLKVAQSIESNSTKTLFDKALSQQGFEPESLKVTIEELSKACEDRNRLGFSKLQEAGLGDWLKDWVRLGSEGEPGTAIVQVFPKTDLWSPELRERFLSELSILEEVEGFQGIAGGMVSVHETSNLITKEMTFTASLAIAIGIVLVLLQFKKITLSLFVLLPVGLSCIWTFGLFELLGYKIHFMNAAVLPMVIGIGIDDGIHIVHKFSLVLRESKKTGRIMTPKDVVSETLHLSGTGVLLTSLTTMVAFGSLAIAENQGLASIGVLSFIGIATSLIASITVLPTCLYFHSRKWLSAEDR